MGEAMKKIMFIGRVKSGKTTLIQALKDQDLIYRKTQSVKYYENILDTPGEYFENKVFHKTILNLSFKYDLIAFVQSSTDELSLYPPNFSKMFGHKEVIGIVTKIDEEDGNIERAEDILSKAGAQKVFRVSAKMGIGIDKIKDALII